MTMKLNAGWHKAHPMPKHATRDQRVRWHVAHAAACACREMPATVVTELRRRAGATHRGGQRRRRE